MSSCVNLTWSGREKQGGERNPPIGADHFQEERIHLSNREREVLAYSAIGNPRVTENLISGEKVVESRYNGHVAIVVTIFLFLGFDARGNC